MVMSADNDVIILIYISDNFREYVEVFSLLNTPERLNVAYLRTSLHVFLWDHVIDLMWSRRLHVRVPMASDMLRT